MLGVVIPAHNEAAFIGSCVRSVIRAAKHPALAGEEVRIFVVLDSCTDGTGDVASALDAHVLLVETRNVGVARATGAAAALAQKARWLAFTDADTIVAPDWLVEQLRCNADAVCGVISVGDWSGHSDAVRENFVTTYHDVDGHRHIHGANLGVSAKAYALVKGFQPLASNEDVALVKALIAAGATIAWSAAPRVTTSARLDSRAPGGFGDALRKVSRRLATTGLPAAALTDCGK
ncbi:glycosyltransferase [Paraburkholderia ginsengisoli]|uniref:Glycosyltransferase family 2 protein n=1 Tax=Paraburkholderia ginsengisoli TaxID=311231 RepID=A0A7T4N9I1_9BURK|nr:glycosyltransferase family A protein [Paraburkholderia ginsengisoli]QQC67696.1 glycosyltransferase family 2 protein [Paraburkholderia ginsengisoli]